MNRIFATIFLLFCVLIAANPAQARHFRHSVHAHVAVSDFSASRKARSHQRRSFRRYAHYRHGGYRVRLAHAVPAAVPQAMDHDGRWGPADFAPPHEAPVRKQRIQTASLGDYGTIREIPDSGPSTGRVCAAGGRCAHVVAWATARFQGAIRDFEAMGYNVGSPGCLSSGHMRHSKHHFGGACDLFNQTRPKYYISPASAAHSN